MGRFADSCPPGCWVPRSEVAVASHHSTSWAGTRPETDTGSVLNARRLSLLMSELSATLQTSEGDIEVDLFDERAPRTVENFVGLATGDQDWEHPESGETMTGPLYDDVEFHRVIEDFMIQTGDPTGTGRGGPGYTFDDEFHDDLRHDSAGTLSMANRGPDTNGSQFFITLAATPHLDDKHAVFGEVTDGMDVVEAIGDTETDMHDRPTSPITLESVEIHD
jgi:peptidyl-prolyl cis-trans isomerase A (cyclophilin A)